MWAVQSLSQFLEDREEDPVIKASKQSFTNGMEGSPGR